MKGEHTLDKDVISKEYISNKERLADIVNAVFYNGKNVIKMQHVIEMDTVVNRVWKRLGWIKTSVFYRDLLRKIEADGYNFLLGIELQSGTDYTIPLRIMNYDLQGYEKMLKAKRKRHKSLKNLTQSEYLSGISRADRLNCIVTIVIYFGEKEWDGPGDLHGMLELKKIPAEILRFIPNYSIHILDVRRINNIEIFKTDLKILIEILQCAMDKQKLKEYIAQKGEEKLFLQEDTYDMICLMTDTPDLLKLKEKYTEEGGKIYMCKAWEELLAETKAEGERSGILLGKSEGKLEGKIEGIQLAADVIRLSIKGLDEKNIAEKCGISSGEVRRILEHVAA